jgi:F0F1-type ATP synthase membrane subunit b/b'
MLRDVDELSERMEQATSPQNEQSSEMKQQMQEARENVQQASRAMDEGRLAEAISEGTRAERQFEDLKEDFRNQTSSQFEEAVRDLREQARELGDRQKELAQQLTGKSAEDDKKQKAVAAVRAKSR